MLSPTEYQKLSLTLTFVSQDSSNRTAETLKASGFGNMHHAEFWGHHQAARLSVKSGFTMFLSHVSAPNGDFTCLAVPEYYAEGVTLSR